jgi:enamine deaminase RidA (YjgF/YER057c/UK114 family)
MEKTIVNPPTLAPPIGFSHGVLVTRGSLLFLAGQTGSNAEGQIIAPGDLVAQYQQTLRNLQTVVESAGGKMQDITKLNIFIRDRDDYLSHLKPLGKVHRSFFGTYYPSMALFEVSGFFQNETLVEMEGFAVINTN